MKGTRLVLCILLLGGAAARASAASLDPLRFYDAAWVKASGDRLARCAGTYRGAAAVMRRGGREEAAAYAENVGSGALFAAYLLLTSPVAVEATVLDSVDVNVHIEALAWGAKRNFAAMDGAEGDRARSDTLHGCTETSVVQSAVLQRSLAAPAVAAVPSSAR
jgi:hypothetical protein